ncbi:monovalent cation/H(+) antiporter subunit G [Pyrococcus kukulkanii]|uniref:Cation:proton antiporter n=1 Tax=Pyrococcus kukulkanii TaxID=1609559 RepID=A0A127B9A6_9EURY|nr:monovalent cation/H(+) antiporter subunit G [Pyrococcus kukulkanii]AMM53941.1 cation:proton antiporter [Pyrococcus kukulkanii]
MILLYIGAALMIIGALCDLLAGIGMLRFKNFYLRLHAATVGTVGGAVVPLIGVALAALDMPSLPGRFAIAGASFITALIILLVAPAGSTALAYAAHRSGVEGNFHFDHLRGEEK